MTKKLNIRTNTTDFYQHRHRFKYITVVKFTMYDISQTKLPNCSCCYFIKRTNPVNMQEETMRCMELSAAS